jgi:hypothetical protein
MVFLTAFVIKDEITITLKPPIHIGPGSKTSGMAIGMAIRRGLKAMGLKSGARRVKTFMGGFFWLESINSIGISK